MSIGSQAQVLWMKMKFGSKSKTRINCSVLILNFLDIIKCSLLCYLFILVFPFSMPQNWTIHLQCTMYIVVNAEWWWLSNIRISFNENEMRKRKWFSTFVCKCQNWQVINLNKIPQNVFSCDLNCICCERRMWCTYQKLPFAFIVYAHTSHLLQILRTIEWC